MASDYRGKSKFHFGLRYALNGLRIAIQSERNIKIHVCASITAIILGIILRLSVMEWAILTLTMGAVISMEMMNTALEKALNHLEPSHQPLIGLAKDMAAGAVFVSAVVSIVIACLIFLPKFI